MTSTGPQRSFCLLFAMIMAATLAFIPGCNGGESEEETNSSGNSATQAGAETASNGSEADPMDEVDSEPLRVVLAFQQAILDLELEDARAMVDETTAAYESVNVAMGTLEAIQNPSLPDEQRQMVISIVRSAWSGATGAEAANEGNSAIIAVTRSNGDIVDVNLNFFDGKWLINSPDDIVQLR